MTDPSQRLFLYGPGYSAQALAVRWQGTVLGTYRSKARRESLERLGIQPVSIADEKALRSAVEGAHVLISAPPDENGCPAHKQIGDFSSTAASLTYLSTTGVYGDLGGGWAMEWSPLNPKSERAKRRELAERAWRQAFQAVCIVRLPGIYGPGRSTFDRLRKGQARQIIKPGHVFSRAHVDDIASGLDSLIRAGGSGAFNLCDDLAAPPQDVVRFAAGLLDMKPPPEVDIEAADLSPMARSFYAECKRVSNARLKAVTGWRPKYRTYRDGLLAIQTTET
nr:hypothetical protein [Hyphomonas sp. Mor2]